jgi:hypothetical protein
VSLEDEEGWSRALRHFESCPEFLKRWNSQRCRMSRHNSNKRSKTCTSEDWEEKLSYCVRHLCPHRCYMRAYAPYRDWHALRASLVERFPDCNVDETLIGWSCILENSDVSLPRTTFLSPQGTPFSSPQQVMRHLCTRDGTGLDHMKIFCESARPSMSRRVGMLAPLAISHLEAGESPFGLLEELFMDDPWRLLLSTILLNRTTRRQVDHVMHEFLLQWPDCLSVLNDIGSNDDASSRMAAVLQPLGMNLRRTAGILRFCQGYQQAIMKTSAELGLEPDRAAFRLSKDNILKLFHCGEYANSAYRIFIQRCCDFDPGDHALTMYAEYQNGAAQSNRVLSL